LPTLLTRGPSGEMLARKERPLSDSRRFVRGGVAAALAALSACAQAQPLFSVANGGPSGLPGDVVFLNDGSGNPVPVGGGAGMGLGRAGDDLIALAPVLPPGLRLTDKFIICFSVDPFAVGVNRLRITRQNLFIQAQHNQQAGDAFLSTEAMQRGVGVLPPPFSMGLENNALGVNQSPFYPNDFALLPSADPGVVVPPGTPLDDVNATLNLTDASPPAAYFTLAQDSPSHPFLPGPDSGATIYLDRDIQVPGNEEVFAGPAALGLVEADQIDGLIVFDVNANGFYDPEDTVYFSLPPDSPTLGVLGAGPGDMLVSEGGGQVAVFVPGSIFGLASGDNMDAMDLVPLVNDSAEDTINAMVPCPADFNGDGNIDTLDVLAFLNAWADRSADADFNGDGAVDTLDILDFFNSWAGGC
jgi:hypothetical protein